MKAKASILIRMIAPIILLPTLQVVPCAAQVAIVVNKSVQITSIDNQDLTDIFSLEKIRWQNGKNVIPVELKGDNQTKTIFYKHLGRSPNDIKRDRLRVILAGEGSPPPIFDTSEEVLEKIVSTPGSIGYLPLEIASTASVNIIKVITP